MPHSRQEVADYLQQVRPQLLCDRRSEAILSILFNAPAPSALAKPFGALMLRAGVDLLPEWAAQMLGLRLTPLQRRLIRSGVRHTAPLLRWAVRNGAVHRARRRLGLAPLR